MNLSQWRSSLVREHRKEKDAEEEEKKSSISLLRGVSIGSNTAAKELLIIKRLRKTEASWAVGEPQVESLDLEGGKKDGSLHEIQTWTQGKQKMPTERYLDCLAGEKYQTS